MDLRLQPVTDAGRRFAELAEEHAAAIAPAAAGHDRDGTFPFDAFESMKASGFMKATVPVESGGLGANSTLDLACALNRLGRADPSVAIAANMHLSFPLIMGWYRRRAAAEGDTTRADALGALIGLFGSGTVAMANVTEAGTDSAHPLLEATKVDGGWLLNGRKIFGTLSPIADLFLTSARVAHDDGTFGSANVFVFKGSAGQEICDNWDGLGMRASGSHDIVYRDCFVPDMLLSETGAWGEPAELAQVTASAGIIGLLGAFLGIAEQARDTVVSMAKTRIKAPSNRPIAERPGIQHLVAEMDVDLEICRAMIERSGALLDRVVFNGRTEDSTLDVLHEVNAQFQCTKLVVNRKAIDVVDRALTVSGGVGYISSHPLARAYRDVRAGPFMQPYSPNEAWEYIARVALGLDPTITR